MRVRVVVVLASLGLVAPAVAAFGDGEGEALTLEGADILKSWDEDANLLDGEEKALDRAAQLKRDMEAAVAREDYDTAANLQDKLDAVLSAPAAVAPISTDGGGVQTELEELARLTSDLKAEIKAEIKAESKAEIKTELLQELGTGSTLRAVEQAAVETSIDRNITPDVDTLPDAADAEGVHMGSAAPASIHAAAMRIKATLQTHPHIFSSNCSCTALTRSLKPDPAQRWCMSDWCDFKAGWESGQHANKGVMLNAKAHLVLKFKSRKEVVIKSEGFYDAHPVMEASLNSFVESLQREGQTKVDDLLLFRTRLFPFEVVHTDMPAWTDLKGDKTSPVSYGFLEQYAVEESVAKITNNVGWAPGTKRHPGKNEMGRAAHSAMIDSWLRWESFFAEHSLLAFDMQFLITQTGQVLLFDCLLARVKFDGKARCPPITAASNNNDPCYVNAMLRLRMLHKATALALQDNETPTEFMSWVSSWDDGSGCTKKVCHFAAANSATGCALKGLDGPSAALDSLVPSTFCYRIHLALSQISAIQASQAALCCIACAETDNHKSQQLRDIECPDMELAVYSEYWADHSHSFLPQEATWRLQLLSSWDETCKGMVGSAASGGMGVCSPK
jgi:hypothetical protein